MDSRFWVSCGVVLTLCAGLANADVCTQRVGRWGGYGETTVVERHGMDLFFGGAVVRCSRLENPQEPIESSLLDLRSVIESGGGMTGIVFDGGQALIALGRDGCALIDTEQPGQPTLLGSYSNSQTGWEVRGIGLMDSMGLLGLSKTYDADVSKFVQLDVSDPDNIVEIGSLEVEGQVQALAVVGRYALMVVSGYEVDPGGEHAPASLRVYDLAQWHGLLESGRLEFPDAEPIAMDIDGDTAYLLNWQGGVHFIDITAPAYPEEVNSVDTDSAGWGGIAFFENNVYVVGSGGLYVVQETPGTVTMVGFYEAGGLGPGLAVYDGSAFVAHGAEGIAIFDVEAPDNPVLLGTTGAARHVSQLAFDGSNIVVMDSSSEPEGRADEVMRQLKTVRSGRVDEVRSTVPPGPVHGVELVGSQLIASISPGWTAGRCGLFPLGLDEPWTPPATDASIDLCPVRDGDRSVMDAGYGVLAVLAESGAEVHLFEPGEPSWPEEVGLWPASVDVTHIQVGVNRLALCRNTSAGVFVDVVGIDDPASPVALGTVALTGTECLDMDVERSRLVVATRNPTHPWATFTDLNVVDLSAAVLEQTVEKVADTARATVAIGDGLVHVVEFVGNHAEHRVVDLLAADPVVENVFLSGSGKTVFAAEGSALAWGRGEDGLEMIRFRRCKTPARNYEGGGRAGP